MENILPEGWVATKIGCYYKLVKDKIEPTQGISLAYVGLEHLVKGGGVESIGDSNDVKSTKTLFKKGDVLYGKLRPYLNKHAFVEFDGVCSTDILAFRSPSTTSAKYLDYYLGTPTTIAYAVENSQGINLPRVSGSIMGELPIPLPPLAEQKRIVAKLDTAFAHLEMLKTSLARIPELLKKFRQTVLTQAVTGKLTEAWREGNSDVERALEYIKQRRKDYFENEALRAKRNGEKPPKRLDNSEFELFEFINKIKQPDYWEITNLKNIADLITDGEHATPSRSKQGYYLLSARNVQDGWISLKNVDYVPEEEYIRIRKRCNPEFNDVLISCSGTVGRVSTVPQGLEFVMVRSAALVKLQSNPQLSKFIEYTLRSSIGQDQIDRLQKSTAQANLFIGPIGKIVVPIPSTEEQQEIVHKVENLFAQADALEAQYVSLKAKIDKLPQALLTKAFRGELVPQDPADEPASVLLEKIRVATANIGRKKTSQTSLAFMEE